MKSPITIVVIDDHALIRHAIRSLVAARPDLHLVGEGDSGEHLFALVSEHQPHVVILDLNMPHYKAEKATSHRFQALPELLRLRRAYPQTSVIILSEHLAPVLVHEAMISGVRGYILKSDDLSLSLPETIDIVSHGGIFFSQGVEHELFGTAGVIEPPLLTPRQIEILAIIANAPNDSYAQHAARLNIQLSSFRNQLDKIFKKMGVNNLTACMIRCHQLGIISLDDATIRETSYPR